MIFSKKGIFFILLCLWMQNITFSEEIKDSSYYYEKGREAILQNDIANASLNFKRALILDPLDSENVKAMQMIREMISPTDAKHSFNGLEYILVFPILGFSMNTLIILGIIFLLIALITYSMLVFSPNHIKYKNTVKIITIVFICLGILEFSLSLYRYHHTFLSKQGILIKQTSLLDLPDQNATILNQLAAGKELKINIKDKNNCFIQTLDGQSGWVNCSTVQLLW